MTDRKNLKNCNNLSVFAPPTRAPHHLHAHPVKCQDGKESVSVHGIKCFLEINEDAKEWHLLQMCKLLGKFCLDDSCPGEAPM